MATATKRITSNFANQDNGVELFDSNGVQYEIVATVANGLVFRKSGATAPPGGLKAVSAKTAAYSPTVAESGTIFTTTGAAGAVTFTLPAVSGNAGVHYGFRNTVGQNMTVAAPAGTLVTFNNAAATSLTFSTASELIGGGIDVVCDGAKWIASTLLAAETQTPTVA